MSSTTSLQVLQWSGALIGLFFVFALGAIVGSFINVLAYRIPRGINVITPPSSCPSCGTKLRWRQNFPIFGWLALRGRCRFCRARISPEYPIVEAAVALLFALLYMLWFMQPSPFAALGLDVNAHRPDWTREGLRWMWPMLALSFLLIASLVAMTLIDAKTFTIPIVLAWIPAGAALLVHPVHAAWIELQRGSLLRSPHRWTIPTAGWDWTLAGIGGLAGLALAAGLLAVGWLPRSYADYEEWEQSVSKDQPKDPPPAATQPVDAPSALGPALMRTLLLTGPAVALMLLGFSLGLRVDRPLHAMAIGGGIGLLIGLILRRIVPVSENDEQQPIWIQYPHARREVLKELLYLLPCALLIAAGWWVGAQMMLPVPGAIGEPAGAASEPPLWVAALGAAALGLLVAGGLVWLVRILGTLALGKEAMGLGDVHLMAGVGATVGWIDPVIAFVFIAPFLGVGWVLLGALFGGAFKRIGSALSYGPHLAAASLLVMYAKPLVELLLSAVWRTPINLP